MRIPTKGKGLPPLQKSSSERLWIFDGSTPPPPPQVPNGAAQTVWVPQGYGGMTVDDVFYNPVAGQNNNCVITMRDANSDPLWRVHVRPLHNIGSNAVTVCDPYYSTPVIDTEGNVYVAIVIAGTTIKGVGHENYDVELHFSNGDPVETFTLRDFSDSGNWSGMTLLLKLDVAGSLVWGSVVQSHGDTGLSGIPATYSGDGAIDSVGGLVLIDDFTLGFWTFRGTFGAGPNSPGNDTTTFMPDTDGSKTQQYRIPGETWFMQVATLTGNVIAQPDRLDRDDDQQISSYWYMFHRGKTPMIITANDYAIASFDKSTAYWAYPFNPSRQGLRYRGDSGIPPAPAYPLNMRWEAHPAGDIANHNQSPMAQLFARNGIAGDPRYAIAAYSTGPLPPGNPAYWNTSDAGSCLVPGTDDVLWAWWMSGYFDGAHTAALKSDRQEGGSWTHNIPGLLDGMYPGFVARVADNPGSAFAPAIDWVVRAMQVNAAGGAAGDAVKLAPLASADDDIFVCGGFPNTLEWSTFKRVDPTTLDTFGPIDGQPLGGNYRAHCIYGTKTSDGTPLWVTQVVPDTPGGTFDFQGVAVRRGREFWIPCIYRYKVTFDPGGPYQEIFSPVWSGFNPGIWRVDITTGEHKAWEPVVGFGENQSIAGLDHPPAIRHGFCDVRDDVPDTIIAIGVPMSTPALVVDNAVLPVTITNVGDSLAGSGMTLNPDGSITGTPTSVGPFEVILKAEDASMDFSYSNRFTLAADPTPGTYPDFTQDVLSAMTPFTPTGSGSSFYVVSGFLPEGVSINPATGEISGTPTGASLLYDSGNGPGVYSNIVVEVDGVTQLAPFNYTVEGVALPMPDLFWSGDQTHDETLTPIAATIDAGAENYTTGIVDDAMDIVPPDKFGYGSNVLQPGSGDFTIVCYAKWDGNPGVYRTILSEVQDGTNHVYFSTEHLYVRSAAAWNVVSRGIDPSELVDRWASYVVVRDAGTELRAYTDGVPDGTGAEAAGALLPSGGPLKIADTQGTGLGTDLSGDLDELAYYRGHAWTEAEAITFQWLCVQGISLVDWPWQKLTAQLQDSFETTEGWT